LSCSARRLSLPADARTRARSSRRSRATAWNFVRTAGVTRPRRAAASTSRTVRASTETTSPPWRAFRCSRAPVRRAPAWRWPGRATDSSSTTPRHGGRSSMPHSPTDGTKNVPSRGPTTSTPSRLADVPGSTQRGPRWALTRTSSRRWPRLVTTARRKPPSDNWLGSSVPRSCQRVRGRMIPGPLPSTGHGQGR
jgi:hypothetical protein